MTSIRDQIEELQASGMYEDNDPVLQELTASLAGAELRFAKMQTIRL